MDKDPARGEAIVVHIRRGVGEPLCGASLTGLSFTDETPVCPECVKKLLRRISAPPRFWLATRDGGPRADRALAS